MAPQHALASRLRRARTAPPLQSVLSSARAPDPSPAIRGCALAAQRPLPAALRAFARRALACFSPRTRFLFPPVETVPSPSPASRRNAAILVQIPRHYRVPRWFEGDELQRDQSTWAPWRRGPQISQ